MFRIKRIKTVLGLDGSENTAVHYATQIAPRGNVLGWDLDPRMAVALVESVVERVMAFYRNRVNAGKLDAEKVKGSAADLARAEADAANLSADEIGRLQAEVRRLQQVNSDLDRAATEAEKAAAEATKKVQERDAEFDKLTARRDELEKQVAAQAEQIGILTAKVAELEKPSATNPDTKPPANKPGATTK